MNKLVSIIMPAYNCEKFIEEAITSVKNQTYSNYELIIIEDASSDSTVNVIKNVKNNDEKIKLYINETNQGVSYSRNKGIDLAKGEWIAFLDSDDFWDKEKLKKQIEFSENLKSDFSFTGVSFVDEKGKPFKGTFRIPDQVNYKKLLKQNVISCSSVLIKKEFFNQFRMEKDETHEDFGLWLRILKKGICAHGLNEPLLIHRISNKTKSGNKFKSLIMTYKTYKFVGLNHFKIWYYLVWYTFTGMKKYFFIKF